MLVSSCGGWGQIWFRFQWASIFISLNHEEKWDKIKLGFSHSVFGFMGCLICIRLFILFLVEIMSTPLPCIIT